MRHVGDAAGAQLAASQSRVEQLTDHVAQLEQQLKTAQVGLHEQKVLHLLVSRVAVNTW